MIPIPCVIFAGGKSSRMGEDKALLPFGEHATLTEFQYDRLQHIFSQVYIACKTRSKFLFEANFIEDNDSTFSPTAAFVSIYETLKTERFFAISVDTPFIDNKVCRELYHADKKNYDATVASIDGKLQPLCGIYHRSMYERFVWMQQNNLHKLTRLLHESHTHTVSFDNTLVFLNINNKEEYHKAIINASLV